MQKWGNTYLDVLSGLIGSVSPAPTATKTNIPLPSPTLTLVPPTPTNTSIPATVTSQNTATPQPVSERTYDDKNSAFVFSSGWQTVNTSNAYNGSYRETTQNGASVTFPFMGQSFSILYKGGVTFSKFDVYVDGTLIATLDQKLSAAAYQKRWDYPGQLTAGSHTLNLVFKVTRSTIYRGSLDAVIVR
jgi:hypothetical protein